jgi:tricorn protease-like protein
LAWEAETHEATMKRGLWMIAGILAGCRETSSPDVGSVVDPGGAIRVTVVTAGIDLPSQFVVTIDNGSTRSIGVNDSTVFASVATGVHTIALGGVGTDCTLAENSPRGVTLKTRDTARTAFTVTCWGRDAGSSQLAFTRGFNIYRTSLNGSGLHQLTTAGWNGGPSWSPDGQRIAFWSAPIASMNLGYGDIYVMNADGSNAVRRTTTGTNSDAVWSPDGRKIAFSSWRLGVGGDVYVVSADNDGTSPVHLSAGCMPQWSPDGSKILFSGLRCDQIAFDDLYVMNVDGSNATRLTDAAATGATYWAPVWSPDGRRIAVTVCSAAACNIAVMNGDGSAIKTIASGWWPSWSPSGRVIAFVISPGGPVAGVYGVGADGSFQGLIVADAREPAWRR